MATLFTLANTPELQEAAYRFRYDVYVTHMGRRQFHADHVRGTIVEPLDETGQTFVAMRDGEVVGTIRSNRADETPLDYYRAFYDLGRFGFIDLSRIQITTKLMVRPDLSRSGLAMRLIQHYAGEAARHGVEVDFLDCNEPLISMFEHMGYVSYCGYQTHKEYGSVRPMFLALDTVSRQQTIGSPIWKAIEQHVTDDAYGGYELLKAHAQHERPLATAKLGVFA